MSANNAWAWNVQFDCTGNLPDGGTEAFAKALCLLFLEHEMGRVFRSFAFG